MLASKVTAKYQATIPGTVRRFLRIKNGDRVKFEIQNNQVVLNKIEQDDSEYLQSLNTMLVEWSGAEDEEAYRDL